MIQMTSYCQWRARKFSIGRYVMTCIRGSGIGEPEKLFFNALVYT